MTAPDYASDAASILSVGVTLSVAYSILSEVSTISYFRLRTRVDAAWQRLSDDPDPGNMSLRNAAGEMKTDLKLLEDDFSKIRHVLTILALASVAVNFIGLLSTYILEASIGKIAFYIAVFVASWPIFIALAEFVLWTRFSRDLRIQLRSLERQL